MKVLVCGGRDYDDLNRLFRELWTLHGTRGPFTKLAHGGARGADTLAGEWAKAAGVETKVFMAQWNIHGKAAGRKRNERMLWGFRPQLVVAFPTGGPGTEHMTRISREAGVEVIEFR